MLEKRMAIIALVLVAVLTVGLLLHNWPYQDRLTERQKTDIEEAYLASFFWFERDEWLEKHRPHWYEENGGRRYNGVLRYFGTYGDCIVLLAYGNGKTAAEEPIKPPFRLSYLSRPVDFPVDVEIMLYNRNPRYPNIEDPAYYLRAPISEMGILKENGVSWLTDKQLEQLTTDLENWLAEGNC